MIRPSAIWHAIVAASESTLEPSPEALRLSASVRTPDPSTAIRLTASAYRSLPKTLELRPTLTVGVVSEILVAFSVLTLLFWWYYGQGLGPAALRALPYGFGATLARILRLGWKSDALAISGSDLIGPSVSFRTTHVRMPLHDLPCDALAPSTILRRRRFGRLVRLRHPNGSSIWFAPYAYREDRLVAFFQGVRQRASAAT